MKVFAASDRVHNLPQTATRGNFQRPVGNKNKSCGKAKTSIRYCGSLFVASTRLSINKTGVTELSLRGKYSRKCRSHEFRLR